MNREERRLWQRGWNAKHPERKKEIDRKAGKTYRFGSVARYNKAMSKYEGKCSFACGKKATLVHHMDGKSTREVGKQQANNNLANLLPLCDLCHMWLHSFNYERQRDIIEKLCTGQYTKTRKEQSCGKT